MRARTGVYQAFEISPPEKDGVRALCQHVCFIQGYVSTKITTVSILFYILQSAQRVEERGIKSFMSAEVD